MKRILLSVFAAAITAAWAVPSSAADITLGGQYRLRGEYRHNADFNGNANDNTDFWGQRIRLTANAKATDDTSVKVTLQDTRNWGAEGTASAGGPQVTDAGTTVNSNIDLHEGYVNVNNIFGAPVTFRAGRQELVYGDERLIGAFNWSNNGRAFDALKFVYSSDVANVDLFSSKVRESTTTNNDQDFHGIYATIKAIPNNSLDLYALWLRDGNMVANSPFGFGSPIGDTAIAGTLTKSQNLYTYGARIKGDVAGLDYTLEVPYQTGTIKTTTNNYKISAYAAAAKVGYTLPTPMKIRVGAEYDYASGDKDGTNDKIKTFFNLFPTNHDKLGLMDQQAWRNVKAFNLNATIDVNEKLRLFASFWNFRLAQKQDAWYAASDWNITPTSTLRGASSTNSKSSVGNEVDLVATYKYNNALTIEGGVARFFEGKFIKDRVATIANSDKADQDWAYLMFTANF